MPHILFVCLGNICRSPLAQGIAEQRLLELGINAVVESAGTAAFNLGKAPDPRAIAAAKKAGYQIEEQRARLISPDDFRRFDYVIAMDRNNLMHVQTLAPVDNEATIEMLGRYRNHGGDPQIADPFYADGARFEALIPILEDAIEGLLTQVQSQLERLEKPVVG